MANKSELHFELPKPNMQLFFTSDTHFFHSSMLKPEYGGRPFTDVAHMNECLIENWNAVVGPSDTVFHLGDFSMSGPKRALEIIPRLNGHKHLIYGNHDIKLRKECNRLVTIRHQLKSSVASGFFESVHDIVQIKVVDPDACQGVQRITLCHYAMLTFNKSHYGAWQLYGHSHSNLVERHTSLQMDVGVDAVVRRHVEPDSSLWDTKSTCPSEEHRSLYRPISYEETKQILSKRRFVSVYHHIEGERQ
jgi:calcineurin-like phosphoesterase family protein